MAATAEGTGKPCAMVPQEVRINSVHQDQVGRQTTGMRDLSSVFLHFMHPSHLDLL